MSQRRKIRRDGPKRTPGGLERFDGLVASCDHCDGFEVLHAAHPNHPGSVVVEGAHIVGCTRPNREEGPPRAVPLPPGGGGGALSRALARLETSPPDGSRWSDRGQFTGWAAELVGRMREQVVSGDFPRCEHARPDETVLWQAGRPALCSQCLLLASGAAQWPDDEFICDRCGGEDRSGLWPFVSRIGEFFTISFGLCAGCRTETGLVPDATT